MRLSEDFKLVAFLAKLGLKTARHAIINHYQTRAFWDPEANGGQGGEFIMKWL